MRNLPQLQNTAANAGLPFALWSAAADAARRLATAWRRGERARATCLTLHSLDDRILRDLGLHRSEIGSVASEIAGDATLTRIRAQSSSRLHS